MKKLLLLTGLFLLMLSAYAQPRHKNLYVDTLKFGIGVTVTSPRDTGWNATLLRGRWIGTSVPADSDFLYWHAPSQTFKFRHEAVGVGVLAAGAGITVNGSTVSHTSHTGDATGATTLTVVQLQGRAMAATAPTTNSVLTWGGAAWQPGYPYSAGTGITITNNSFSGNYTGGTGILVSSNTISIYYDTLTHVKAGRDLYKNGKYIFTSGGKSGIGTVSAANLAGDSVDYAMFIFNKWGRVSFITSTSNFDTLGTRSKLIMNDTNIGGTYSTYIKNNLGVFRRFTIEYTYKPY